MLKESARQKRHSQAKKRRFLATWVSFGFIEGNIFRSNPTQTAPGSKTLVIHPGSRWLKIGMASDVFPVSVPNVIARKRRAGPVPEAVFHNGVISPASERNSSTTAREGHEIPAESDEDPVRYFLF